MIEDTLDTVSLLDIKWAVTNNYETDTIWATMNIVSILSSNKQDNRKYFRQITGIYPHKYTSHPASNWSGYWGDVKLLLTTLYNNPISLPGWLFDNSREISIRLKRFPQYKKSLVFGQSSFLKKDYNDNYYLWMYNSKKQLVQVPEQTVKEQMILWDYNHNSLFNS